MRDRPGQPAGAAVAETLWDAAHGILAEARTALEDGKSDAVAVHDFRKAMKRWRAFLRLVEPHLADEHRELRASARELARELAGARDAQSALDALADLGKGGGELSPRSAATMTARLETIRRGAETTTLTGETRERLHGALDAAIRAVAEWDLSAIGFVELAAGLCEGYRRARRSIPAEWLAPDPEALHELRQCVVVHRYQMELIEPLWPKLGRVWVAEAQRLRERLGACQDLTVLTRLSAPHQPLAPWRSRLAPPIEARRREHVRAAARLARRLFAERPKAFRRRLEALWDTVRDNG